MQKTLLIVDDEPAILSSLKRMLYRAGYKTLLATSGAEALQVLQDNPDIRVVLSDFRMPVMTGGELLVEIKQRYPRVIGLILSGYADLDSVLEALNSGAVFKFLTKPWDENSLLDTVGLAFQRSVSEESESNIVLGVDQLLSRSKLLENLSTWMDSKAPVTVFYLDIKKFHTFNDSLGYEVADELLASVAHTLMQNIPDTGVLGQMSGDEFVLLLPHACSLEESQRLIGRFLQPFNELVSIAGRELHLSFSVGYGVAPQDGKTPELLVRNAQVAANRAKHLGPGCVLRYQITMNEKCRELVDLNSDLYRALEKDTLSVVYQPKVCLKTGNIVGAESLLRWNHHALGMVSPATFIPLAESSGLIEPIGEWVLSMASSQSKAWSLEGLPELLISVNVSGRQLQRNTLAKKIKNILQVSGASPSLLELEITETFLMQDIDNSLKLLHELKELGIRLSIDDFGTGYSSLNYLSSLPADTLKIDRSFVKKLAISEDRVGLVRNVIQMSHDLGMSVVAEGVETKAQLDILRGFNCDEIQGFYFSPPVAAEEFRSLLINQPLIGTEFKPTKKNMAKEGA